MKGFLLVLLNPIKKIKQLMENRNPEGSLFAERVSKKGNRFIRIQIILQDGIALPLTLDKNQTIEYVARQIEAEASFRNIKSVDHEKKPEVISSKIDCYQIYDAYDIALPFSGKVQDLLSFDEVLFPLTSLKGGQNFSLVTNLLSDLHLDQIPSDSKLSSIFAYSRKEEISPDIIEQNQKKEGDHSSEKLPGAQEASTLEERLKAVLYSKKSVGFFKRFCIQERSLQNLLFWIEVETLRAFPNNETRLNFSNYLLDMYLKENAPLSLNFDSDFYETIHNQSKGHLTNLFDELQSFILIFIKKSYALFEESQLFAKLMQFKSQDPEFSHYDVNIWSSCDLIPISIVSETNDTVSNRVYILQMIHDRYFPDSVEFSSDYFNIMGHKAQRRLNYPKKKPFNCADKELPYETIYASKKTKKLASFFGEIIDHPLPSNSSSGATPNMNIQNIQPGMATQPIGDENMEINLKKLSDYSGLDLRQKAEDLKDCFDNSSVSKLHRIESVVSELSILAANDDLNPEFSQLLPEQIDLLENIHQNVNQIIGVLGSPSDILSEVQSEFSDLAELSEEEKLVLQKRAKELAKVLKGIKEGKQLPPEEAQVKSILSGSVEGARLEKLTQMTGEKITPQNLQQLESSGNTRQMKMTPEEKIIFKKKSIKLERILGNSVRIDNQAIKSNEDSSSVILSPYDFPIPKTNPYSYTWPDESDQTKDEKSNQIMRLRKLEKMLGLTENGAPVSREAVQEIQEAIINAANNEIEKIKLEDKLNNRNNQDEHRPMTEKEKKLRKKKLKKLHALLGTNIMKDLPYNSIQTKISHLKDVSLIASIDESQSETSPLDKDIPMNLFENDIKKKADKLKGFFGSPISSQEVKLQKLIPANSSFASEKNTRDSSFSSPAEIEANGLAANIDGNPLSLSKDVPAAEVNEQVYNNHDTIILSAEEKALLQTKIINLYNLLGTNINSWNMHQTQSRTHMNEKGLLLNEKAHIQENEMNPDNDAKDSNIDYRNKSGRLTGFFGYEMTSREFKFQKLMSGIGSFETAYLMANESSSDESDLLAYQDEWSASGSASQIILTNNHLETSQASIKDEEISFDKSNLSHFSHVKQDSSFSDLDRNEKSKELQRLQKLKKLLGIEGNALSVETLQEIQGAINQVAKKQQDRKPLIGKTTGANSLNQSSLTAEEKAFLQKKNKKLNELLGFNLREEHQLSLLNQFRLPEKITEKIGLDEDTENLNNNHESKWPNSPEVGKRKKADKLAGFFGSHLSDTQMKSQTLFDEFKSTEIENNHVDPAELTKEQQLLIDNIHESTRKLIKNHADEYKLNVFMNNTNNDEDLDSLIVMSLYPEEKAKLEKEASDLFKILGRVKDEESLGSIPEALDAKTDAALHQDVSGNVSQIITETQSKGKSMESSFIEEDTQLIRPSSTGEHITQKKLKKLERLLGDTAASNVAIDYNTTDYESPVEGDNKSLSRSGLRTKYPENEDKKSQTLRLKKLKKMLGLDESALLSQGLGKEELAYLMTQSSTEDFSSHSINNSNHVSNQALNSPKTRILSSVSTALTRNTSKNLLSKREEDSS